MFLKHLLKTSILFSFFLLTTQISCFAGSPPAKATGEGKTGSKNNYRFSYTPIYQFETDLDSGGQFDVQRHFLRFDASRSIDTHWTVGLGLSFDYESWDFSNIAGLHSVDLWDEIIRPGISIPVFYTPSKNWRFGLIPSINFAGASGAETSESLSYGTVLSGAYAFSPQLMLGLGAGIFERLDQFEMFPYVVINWKINEQFRLKNPFPAGPVGPAGMELVYTPTPSMEMGIGGAYRSYRFRLDDSSTVADGIGEMNFWAPFLRVGWNLGRGYRFDVNTGLLMDGSITIEDAEDRELGETDFDATPFVGVTLKGRF